MYLPTLLSVVLYNKTLEKGKNRCLVFLNGLIMFCSVVVSLKFVSSHEPKQNQGLELVDQN